MYGGGDCFEGWCLIVKGWALLLKGKDTAHGVVGVGIPAEGWGPRIEGGGHRV